MVGGAVGVSKTDPVAEKEAEGESLEKGLEALLDTFGEGDVEVERVERGTDALAPTLEVVVFVTHIVGVALPTVP